jgi:hypothetical protein
MTLQRIQICCYVTEASYDLANGRFTLFAQTEAILHVHIVGMKLILNCLHLGLVERMVVTGCGSTC